MVLVEKLLQNLRKLGVTLKFLVADGCGFDLGAYICKRHVGGRAEIDRPEKRIRTKVSDTIVLFKPLLCQEELEKPVIRACITSC